MDTTAQNVLISIHPEYVDLIFAGKKRIEFRKCNIPSVPRTFLVYATSPVSQIVGYFVSEFVEKATPNELWSRYANIGGISREKYFSYYKDKKVAIGIHVSTHYEFHNKINPKDVGLLPPQSFQYITQEKFNEILAMSH